MRGEAKPKTIAKVRECLAEHGIERSYHGVQTLLANKLLVGDIEFGAQRAASARRLLPATSGKRPKPSASRVAREPAATASSPG
jgi:hypothetical protein